jgi:hypothetical protein
MSLTIHELKALKTISGELANSSTRGLPGQSLPRATVCAHKQIGTECVLEVTKSQAES